MLNIPGLWSLGTQNKSDQIMDEKETALEDDGMYASIRAALI